MWDPHTKCLQEELEKVQNRAARFVKALSHTHEFELRVKLRPLFLVNS